MTEVREPGTTIALETDLVSAIRHVLQTSAEPLTIAKIRTALLPSFGGLDVDLLADTLNRQVAAHVLVLYPKYRSQQDRFWDRPFRVHLEQLLCNLLGAGPLTWSEIRKRLPDYAKIMAESVLDEQVARGKFFRHPPASARTGPRYGLEPADPRPHVQAELALLVSRLETSGFARAVVRETLLDLLREEEWAARLQPRRRKGGFDAWLDVGPVLGHRRFARPWRRAV